MAAVPGRVRRGRYHSFSYLELVTKYPRAAGAALYRRITPCGSSVDGDIVFAVSAAEATRVAFTPMIVESLAVAALEKAIERAVRMSRGREGIPGLADGNGD